MILHVISTVNKHTIQFNLKIPEVRSTVAGLNECLITGTPPPSPYPIIGGSVLIRPHMGLYRESESVSGIPFSPWTPEGGMVSNKYHYPGPAHATGEMEKSGSTRDREINGSAADRLSFSPYIARASSTVGRLLTVLVGMLYCCCCWC